MSTVRRILGTLASTRRPPSSSAGLARVVTITRQIGPLTAQQRHRAMKGER